MKNTFLLGQVTPTSARLAYHCEGSYLLYGNLADDTIRKVCQDGTQTVFVDNVPVLQIYRHNQDVLILTTEDNRFVWVNNINTWSAPTIRSWSTLGAGSVTVLSSQEINNVFEKKHFIRLQTRTLYGQHYQIDLDWDSGGVDTKLVSTESQFLGPCVRIETLTDGSKLCLSPIGRLAFAPSVPFRGVDYSKQKKLVSYSLSVTRGIGREFYSLRPNNEPWDSGGVDRVSVLPNGEVDIKKVSGQGFNINWYDPRFNQLVNLAGKLVFPNYTKAGFVLVRVDPLTGQAENLIKYYDPYYESQVIGSMIVLDP